MEIDNLKNLWNKDKQEDLPEISLEKKNEIHSPLQMLKINMQTEFWILILTLPMLLLDLNLSTKDVNIKIISIFTTVLMFFIMVYFYSRFIKLYKLLRKSSINTNYDLFTIKTQLLVARETYVSYLITYIPLAFILSLIKINFHFDIENNIAIFAISFLITLLVVFVFIKYWLYYLYGKYIEDVVRIVDDLNGVESTVKIKKKNTWFEFTQVYFMKKFGIKGNVINTVLWIVGGFSLMVVILAIILIIVMLIGVSLNYFELDDFIDTINKI